MAKIIKTDAEYQAALVDLERLMKLNPALGSPEADELELLALLVENYEKAKFPIAQPDPVQAIEFRMDQQSLTPRDLIPFLGSRSRVSEVLARKRTLTLSMVRALHEGLGIPANLLIQENSPDAHFEKEDSSNWLKYPLREMIKREWISDSFNSISAFFDHLPATSRASVLCRQTENIRSARPMDSFALTAWTTRIVIEANKLKQIGKYRPGAVNPDSMRSLAKVSRSDHGPAMARSFLSELGVPLVIEPHLPNTHLDGAAILLFKERPIIGLTIRYDRLDNFWFTLMHELAHVHLHSQMGYLDFFDDLDIEESRDPREQEADELAGEVLIPKASWLRSAARNSKMPQAAEMLAAELQVHTAIVAGRMRRHWKAYRLFNNLVGHHQVRSEFTGIKWEK